jgi:hypothetical protein
MLTLMADDPAWLKEMLSDLSTMILSLTEELLRRIVPDLCWLGGDFCYKGGPLMSPAAFREFLFPEFRKVAEVREAFPRFHIFGGLDKKAVAKGRAAIDDELERKVPRLVRRGGWVPYIDHAVPPDIGWDDFVYYRRRLAELAGGRKAAQS